MAVPPFIIFEDARQSFFVDERGKRRGPYSSIAVAEVAATSSRGRFELEEKCKFLATIYRDEPDISLTLLNIGFAQLGQHRLKCFLSPLTKEDEFECLHVLLGGRSSDPVFNSYVSLFDDIVQRVDWPRGCAELQTDTLDLVSAIVDVLAEPAQQLEGYEARVWVGALLGIAEVEIGRFLDRKLLHGNAKAPKLANLATVRRRCEFPRHIFYLSKVVLDRFFITDLTNIHTRRDDLVEAFTQKAASIEESVIEIIARCEKAAEYLVTCAGNKARKDLVKTFLHFDRISWSSADDLRKFASRGENPVSRAQPRINERSSGPKIIDYARCHLSATSIWDYAPIRAGIYPAFGQTPDPRGHRA